MDTNTSPTHSVVLKYTLDRSDDIALNCDHWTPTDFAGAIDSGLLIYEGLLEAGSAINTPIQGDDTTTVFIYADIPEISHPFEIENFSQSLVDALQSGACSIEVSSHHTVVITIKVNIADNNASHRNND